MAELKITAGPQGTNVDDYEVEFVENVPLGIVIGTISGDPAATQYSFYIDDDGVKWDGEGRVTIVGDKIYLSTTGPGLNYEMASGAYQIWIVAKNAAGDEVNQAVFGLSLADANDAPTDLTVKNATGGTTFSFQENTTPTGTFVAVLTSKDEDRTAQGGAGDTFTYSLVDDLGGRFKVATATVAGKTQYQIQAGSNGTLIDFEDYGAGKLLKSDDNGNSRYYELKVRVTDGGGPDGASAAKYTEQTIKVYVTNDTADDQNLPPNAPTGGSGTLKENTASTNTLVQLAGSTDPEGLAVTYDFAANGNPNSLFALSADGKLTLATGKTLDYEAAGLSSDGTGKYYLVKVVAKDPAGNASTATDVKVYVTNDTADDQNLPPNAPTGGSGTLKENTASTNTLVQLAGSTDPEGLAVTYDFAANGNPNSLFALSADGKLTLATGKTLDYEAAGLSSDGTGKYYLVKVVAKDPAGNASTATDVKVYVTNDTADDQNAPPQIGGVPATPTTVVTIKDTATATPFSNVTITDDSTVTVLVSLDNKAKGTLVGEGFAWVDALQAYKFEGSAAAAQTAIKNLVFTPTARPNGAVNAAEDTTFTISVSDNVNPAVTNSTIRVRSEVENRAPILVAAAYNPTILHSENINLVNPFKDVSIGETNAGDMVTVTITLDDFAKGDLKNLNDFVRNENAKTYTFIGSAADAQVKIRALQYDPRDRPGSAASEVTSFTISVQDNHQDTATVTNTNIKVTSLGVNSAPTGLTLGANSVKEYSLAGQEIGTLAATDVNGDALTYKLLDNAGGRFAIVNNKLVLAGPGVNFEEAASHQVKIQVSDGRGGTTEQVFTVNVLDETTLNKKGTKKNDKLNGGLLDDILKGGTGNGRDTIKGLAGDDKLYGENGNDSILGGDGIDRLYGGNQDDILKGDAGNDFLYGEAGIDKLYGGLGKDTFIFNKKPSKTANLDKIMDFNVADDTIWLENSVFKKLGKAGSEAMPAVLNAVNFVIGSKAKDRDDFIIYNNKKGILYYDADGSGKGAAVEIASMKKNLKLTIDDFKII